MSNKAIKIDEAPNLNLNKFSQDYLLRKYSEDKRPDFNDKFFKRTDNDIIIELEKVILSWQREKYFVLKVINFEVETSYSRIEEIVNRHNNERNKNKSQNKKRDEDNDYLNLKDSYTMLLIVDYYIEVFNTEGPNKDKKTKDTMQVLILVPRIVDDIFLYIKGNYYCPTYQISDGSIYNNSDKINSKNDVVVYKADRPIRIIRKINTLLTYDDNQVKCVMYTSLIFNKPGIAMRFIFAKFGLNHGLGFLGLNDIVIHKGLPFNDETKYLFKTNNIGIYVSVPKFIYDNDFMTQSAVATICSNITANIVYEEIFTVRYWVGTLTWNFKGNPDYDNGEKLLYNLETIYTIKRREILKLPDKDKSTIYHVLRWIMREFPELRVRDNVDIYYKRIVYGEYIALLYSAKLSKAVLDLSDMRRNNLTIDTIKRRIYTKPDLLLQYISKDSLKNHINRVNDNHAFTVLKASYKGVSGIGENSKNSIPDRYKNVHYSNAGVIDMTSSSATDPGMTTLLCPLGNVTEDGFFYDYKEPNGWEESYNEIMNNYYKLNNLRQVLAMEQSLLDKDSDYYVEQHMIIESLEILKRLIEPFKTLDSIPMVHIIPKHQLEESGSILYEQSDEG